MEATDFINGNRHAVAGNYGKMTALESVSVLGLARMLADPQLGLTLPKNVVGFAACRVRIGTVRSMPDSWRDRFFPDMRDLPRS